MKQIISVFLILSICLIITGCTKANTNSTSSLSQKETQAAASVNLTASETSSKLSESSESVLSESAPSDAAETSTASRGDNSTQISSQNNSETCPLHPNMWSNSVHTRIKAGKEVLIEISDFAKGIKNITYRLSNQFYAEFAEHKDSGRLKWTNEGCYIIGISKGQVELYIEAEDEHGHRWSDKLYLFVEEDPSYFSSNQSVFLSSSDIPQSSDNSFVDHRLWKSTETVEIKVGKESFLEMSDYGKSLKEHTYFFDYTLNFDAKNNPMAAFTRDKETGKYKKSHNGCYVIGKRPGSFVIFVGVKTPYGTTIHPLKVRVVA